MKGIIPDRFTVIRTIRTDRNSMTFVGRDHVLERSQVLIKVFRNGQFDGDASALAQRFSWFRGTHHPHLAIVFQAGLTPKKHFFYVREYLPSTELFSASNSGVIEALVAAVRFLQVNNCIHGALKPSNVFFSSGVLKLADPRIEGIKSAINTKEGIGFTAPEVLKGGKVTFESDIYSIGMILYRLLTGRDPFDDCDIDHLKSKYLYASPRSIVDLCHVSKSLSDIVGQLVDKDPLKRRRAFEALIESLGSPSAFANRAAFVGRAAILKQTEQIFEDKTGKGLRMLLVEGEPGIGKSRLVDELETHCLFRSRLVSAVCCKEKISTPCEPVVQGIRKLLYMNGMVDDVSLGTALETSWPTLSRLFIPSHNLDQCAPAYPFERVVSELVSLLSSIARRQATVFVIEDIHRADAGTEEFIKQLCFRAAELPVTLVLTRRTDSRPFKCADLMRDCLHGHFTHIRLMPLTATESRLLTQLLTGSQEHQDTALRMSAGNPRFIEEYLKSYIAGSTELPSELDDALTWILSNTEKSCQSVLESLSLFQDPMDVNIIAALSQVKDSDLQAKLVQLECVGMANIVGTSVILKYPAARTKIYSSLSDEQKIRLNSFAHELLQQVNYDQTILAHLLFEARRFKEASGIYLQLAEENHQQKNFSSALTFYQRFERSERFRGSRLSPAVRAKMAHSHRLTGNHGLARKLYRKLLSTKAAHEDPELQSFVCASLASLYGKRNTADRIRLNRLAIDCLPTDSPNLGRRHLELAAVLMHFGDIPGAERALKHVEALESGPHNGVQHTKASLLIIRGDFKGAIPCLEASQQENLIKGVNFSNLALCHENLGHLTKARDFQLRAQELATRNGVLPLQLLSLSNLGCIETKLGNMRAAEQFFAKAHHWVEHLMNRDKEFNTTGFTMLYSDTAFHSMQIGQYHRTIEYLNRFRQLIGTVYEIDRLVSAIVQCEFLVLIGQIANATALLSSLERSPTFHSDFFQVERILLEAKVNYANVDHVAELTRAVEITERIGTLYQKCQVFGQLSVAFNAANQRQRAKEYAKATLRLAKANGYRPLAAKALLLVGIASEDSREKQVCLFDALQNAVEMGLHELRGEASFHIGAMQLAAQNYMTAREYLVKSISISAELADPMPSKFRVSYLASSWRRDGRKLLENCTRLIQSDPYWIADQNPTDREDRYFRAAYRLTMSSHTASNPETLVEALLQTLAAMLARPVFITLKGPHAVSTKSIRIKSSEELDKRVALVRQKARARTYFGSTETGNVKDTVAWIPLRSDEFDGGIYVACSYGESPFSEREMEFLTVVGSITNGALHHIHHRDLQERLHVERTEFHGLIGASKAIREVYSHIEIAAGNAATVLIEGESGTGKELVARAIHQAGARAKEAFIAVDCGAIPEGLIEAELFGAKRGSYTGAIADRPGLFEAAHRGTIFLDEISNTTPALQAKLLRVIQEREVRRIGETKGRAIDVRLIVASNADLESLAEDGQFRKDLLYRLKVLHIKVPPLRNRADDIPMLVHAFLERLNASNNTKKYFAPGIISHLSSQSFPGNVRELQNVIERAFFSARGTMITDAPMESRSDQASSADEIQSWFKELSEGRKDFWTAVHNRYKRRDISREKVVALVDFGLRSTRGNYRTMASMLRLKKKDYRRFMDFLRRNDCLLDFRPYRKAAAEPS